MRIHSLAALLVLVVVHTSSASAEQIHVTSCVGQLVRLDAGLVFTIVDHATPAAASVTVSDGSGPITLHNAGSGTFSVTVPHSWTASVLAMFDHQDFPKSALLNYHMNGGTPVLDSFRLSQGYGPSPECHP